MACSIMVLYFVCNEKIWVRFSTGQLKVWCNGNISPLRGEAGSSILPTFILPIAQWLEQEAVSLCVASSNLAGKMILWGSGILSDCNSFDPGSNPGKIFRTIVQRTRIQDFEF